MKKCYAGIGSRKTPADVLGHMKMLSAALYELGYCLRSGGAPGADQAFESNANGREEIFLPRNDLPLWTQVFTMHFHPNPSALTLYSWFLMNRNAMQILGLDGNSPVEFVICWTKDGKDSGGTGQAIRIAEAFDIPVYNLYFESHFTKLLEYLASV